MVKDDVAGQGQGRYLPGRFCEVEVADGPGFDCITEVPDEDREAFKTLAQFVISEVGKVIFGTEATFMYTSKTVAGLLQETTTSRAHLQQGIDAWLFFAG